MVNYTYKGVKRDFEMCGSLGGIINLHDIVPHPPYAGCEVNKFWNEIKHSYRRQEIVKIGIREGRCYMLRKAFEGFSYGDRRDFSIY
jgi:hypothetical protein